MSTVLTGIDSIREYLTGAVSDGALQDHPDLSIGGFRSRNEAFSLAIHLGNPIKGVHIQHASASNLEGIGLLQSNDADLQTLSWKSPGSLVWGAPVTFPLGETTVAILEGSTPGKYLRVSGTPPFALGATSVRLTVLVGNVFGFNLVADANAVAGISQYRATILRNESVGDLSIFSRWIEELAPSTVSDQGQLGGSGSGAIKTSYGFTLWPGTGWCRIEQADGTLREIVYYSSRSIYQLNIPASGRSRLGTSAAAGAADDVLRSVPGLAIGFDAAGVQVNGSAISTIVDDTTPPAGVIWNSEVSKPTGLRLPDLRYGHQIGIWMWREMPTGSVFSPNVYNDFATSFFSY